jgi:hypothetical protein
MGSGYSVLTASLLVVESGEFTLVYIRKVRQKL